MIVVAALYKFFRLEDYKSIREQLLKICLKKNIKGTLLLAVEGINGTIAGERESIDVLLGFLKRDLRFSNIEYKESFCNTYPFSKMKIKIKKEIVTMGVQEVNPTEICGTYVKPKDWNELICDPNVLLVDTRNYYEYELGSFKNAINPHTEKFRDFPNFVRNNLQPKKHKKVAMFCTGGIRCEKSTSYMKQQGFEEVYHLQGGILKYLEDVPPEESLWDGECYVFDDRVSVNHSLKKGNYEKCRACRLPITEKDMQKEGYQIGISCARCYNKRSSRQRDRYAERQKQMDLSKGRCRKNKA